MKLKKYSPAVRKTECNEVNALVNNIMMLVGEGADAKPPPPSHVLTTTCWRAEGADAESVLKIKRIN